MRGGGDDQLDVKPGISRDQRLDDRDRAVARILDAESELNLARIILMEIGLEMLGKSRLGAEEGLQDRDARPRGGRRCARPPREPHRRRRRAQGAERPEDAGCDEKQRQAPDRERANVFETMRHVSMAASLGRQSDVEVTLCGRLCDKTLRNGGVIVPRDRSPPWRESEWRRSFSPAICGGLNLKPVCRLYLPSSPFFRGSRAPFATGVSVMTMVLPSAVR